MKNFQEIDRLLREAMADPAVGELTLNKITKWGGNDTSLRLLDYYGTSEEKFRPKLIEILGKIKDIRAVEPLVKILQSESDSVIRASLVKALGNFGSIDVIPVLAGYLNDPDTRVRANTVEGLSLIYDARIPELLLPLLDDEDNRVRANTAIALWKYDELRTIVCEAFENMLKNPSRWMRASAYYAFGEVDLEAFVLQLTAALGHEDEDVCRSAVVALIGYAEKFADSGEKSSVLMDS